MWTWSRLANSRAPLIEPEIAPGRDHMGRERRFDFQESGLVGMGDPQKPRMQMQGFRCIQPPQKGFASAIFAVAEDRLADRR